MVWRAEQPSVQPDRVKGEATQEQLEELVRLAQDRSPVFDIVSHPVPVSVRLEKR
jgi:uncharacterized OsmC-like protein